MVFNNLKHLWGGGGAPFKFEAVGVLKDKSSNNVHLMGQCQDIFSELYSSKDWENTTVAFSSGCDEPDWARECIKKFMIDEKTRLCDVVKHIIIDKRPKSTHIKEHCKALGIENYSEVIFFDNERWNCENVSKLGCTTIHCPKGLSAQVWTEANKVYPKPGKIIKL